ncbi:hypothetical protein H6F89_14180 [Cyanobacteria bacterium FACHB-63]|nr:hypothetical protein [Cyanobacteria bacterium FACHB-63]
MTALVLSPHSPTPTEPLPVVRQAVRDLLLATPAYQELSPDHRRQMAELMVRVCHTAASLVAEEIESDTTYRTGTQQDQFSAPFAIAQSAGSDFSGVSAQRVAGTTRAILNAVSFPRFVTELINGVFKAIVDSNMQQLHQYIDLLNNVAATTEGFVDLNMAPARAREWLVERFPGSFEISGGTEEEPSEAGFSNEPDQDATLQLRSGGSMPPEQALRTALGLEPNESVPSGDPERILVPLVRRYLARNRQEMLATLVQMGMQRIVIDSGRINAAMRFHIDTHSAAQADQGSRFDLTNQISASGSFGFGPWGASASLQNTIGYVSTQQSRTTEELNTDLELTSSVELNFHSDYVPLNRLASSGQAQRIEANSRNPDFEATRRAEEARRQQSASNDAARADGPRQQLQPHTPASPPDTLGAAERARREAATNRPPRGSSNSGQQPTSATPSPTSSPTTPATSPTTPATSPSSSAAPAVLST